MATRFTAGQRVPAALLNLALDEAAQSALTDKTAAVQAKTGAVLAQTGAEQARDVTQAARDQTLAAKELAVAAAGAAGGAATSQTAAAISASGAATSAVTAGQARDGALAARDTTIAKATEAGAAATAAAVSQGATATARTLAEAAATAAGVSRDAAAGSAAYVVGVVADGAAAVRVQVSSDADRAQQAASLSAASANLYTTTTAGLAAVAEGATFNVIGDTSATYAITYRKTSGAAVEVARYPSKAALDGITTTFTYGAPRTQDGLEIWGEHLVSGYGLMDWGPQHFRAGGMLAQRGLDGSWTLSDPKGAILTRSAAGKVTYTDLPISTVAAGIGADHIQAGSDGRGFAAAWNRQGVLQLLGYPEISGTAVGDFTAARFAALAAEARAYTDRVRRAAVDLHQPTEGLVLWLAYGQSLSSGWEGWPALSKTAPPDCYMMGQSVHPASENAGAWNPVGGSTDLQPLKATVRDDGAGLLTDAQVAALSFGATNRGETILEGFAAQFRRAWLRARGKVSDAANQFLFASCGVGGTTITQLSSTGTFFQRFRDAVIKAQAIAAAQGVTFSVGGVLFDQGEWDYVYATTYDSYVALLTQLIADIRTFVASQVPSQTGVLPIYFMQTGGQYADDTMQLAIARAQIQVARTVPGVFLTASNQPVTDKNDHLTSNGYRWLGCQIGKAATRTLIDGVGFECTRVIRWTYSGKTLVGLLHLPEGDAKGFASYVGRIASTAAVAGDLGLYVEVAGAQVPVTATRFEQGRLLVATLATAPTVAPTIWLGRSAGTQGAVCLSDSDRTPLVYPYVYTAGSGQTADESIPALVGLTYPSENVCLADVQTATAA